MKLAMCAPLLVFNGSAILLPHSFYLLMDLMPDNFFQRVLRKAAFVDSHHLYQLFGQWQSHNSLKLTFSVSLDEDSLFLYIACMVLV